MSGIKWYRVPAQKVKGTAWEVVDASLEMRMKNRPAIRNTNAFTERKGFMRFIRKRGHPSLFV